MSTTHGQSSVSDQSAKTEEAVESPETQGDFAEGPTFADPSLRFKLEPSNIIKLQKVVGNRTVTRMITQARTADTVSRTAETRSGTPKVTPAAIQRLPLKKESMFSLGKPEVIDLQKKLNFVGVADPELVNDGWFGDKTEAAVKAFQKKKSLKDDGVVETETWNKLGEVIKDLRKKLNSLGVADEISGKQIILAETVELDAKLTEALQAFQKIRSIPETGKLDDKTQKALDAPAKTQTTALSEVVGGVRYGVTAKYDWQLTDDQMVVTVKIKFGNEPAVTPALVNVKLALWIDYIKNIWNGKFKAEDTTPTTGTEPKKSISIVFNPMAVTGGEHANVLIAAGSGRANAGKWYVEGESDEEKVIAHEFGHLVSLPDEYQLSHGDFQTTTGAAAPAGATAATDGATADTVATEMKTALDETVEATRVTKAAKVVSDHGLKQGSFTESVVTKYKDKYSKDLVDELAKKIPSDKQWSIIDPFTHSTGGIMGNFHSAAQGGSGDNAINSSGGPSGTPAHDHPLAARHMKPFIDHIKSEKPGNWEAKYLT